MYPCLDGTPCGTARGGTSKPSFLSETSYFEVLAVVGVLYPTAVLLWPPRATPATGIHFSRHRVTNTKNSDALDSPLWGKQRHLKSMRRSSAITLSFEGMPAKRQRRLRGPSAAGTARSPLSPRSGDGRYYPGKS